MIVYREAIAVKKLVILSMVVLGLSSQLASAQGLLVPPAEGFNDAPPEATSPGFNNADVPPSEDSIFADEPDMERIPSGDLRIPEGLEPNHAEMFAYAPALLESTGTWLRRGFWFAEVDAVLYNRNFNRKDFSLMEQEVLVEFQSQGSTIPGGTPSSFPTINLIPTIENQLAINGSDAGFEGVPRFKLGRFLFRDQHNRDHTAEFIVFGGGEWSQRSQLDANPNNNRGTTTLFVPFETDHGNASFDGATSTQYDYDSRFNSFELNYHVKSRLQRDRMELEPSGHWVRRAQPTFTKSFLGGVRFFDLNEDLDWDVFGIDADNTTSSAAESGTFVARTDNDMIGTHIGGSFAYESARWSFGAQTKGGMFINRMDVDTQFEVTNTNRTGNTDLEEYNMAFVGEGSLIGKVHLRPNFSFRASLELLYATGMALAPEQVTFVPSGLPSINSNGYSVFLGGGIGFEGYW